MENTKTAEEKHCLEVEMEEQIIQALRLVLNSEGKYTLRKIVQVIEQRESPLKKRIEELEEALDSVRILLSDHGSMENKYPDWIKRKLEVMENKPYSLQDTWDQHFEYGTGSYNAGKIPIPIHNCIKDMIFKATEELRKENDELKEKVHIKHQKFCETFSLAELRTQGLNQAVDKLEKIQNELSKAFLKIAEQYTEIERLTQSNKGYIRNI